MEFEIRCSFCNQPSHDLVDYKCSSCGKPLNVQLRLKFEKQKIQTRDHSLWRYARFFPYISEADIVTLGEGWTPLVKFSENVLFKLDNLNPTGSFKDRGSTVLISALHKKIKEMRRFIAEDSSGNAGASMTAYAARAELKARIYVPERVSGPKFNQICSYGAEVVRVSGDRSKVAEEAQKPEKGKVYVGHILHPLFRDGIRTLAYEIAEQSSWQVPDRVYLPVSAGTLLLGVIEGFRHLKEAGVVDHIPKIVACQTEQVSPLYHQMKNLKYSPPEKITSVADALVSTNPPLLGVMVEKLKDIHGDAVMADEKEIMLAFRELASRGFFVEPSSAVAYAAYKQQLESEEDLIDEQTVIVLTGMGLKARLPLG